MIGLCKITYDWGTDGEPPGAGCYLRGQGARGLSPKAYLIHSARLVKSERYPGRYALSCERIMAADIPADAPVYTIRWYSRNRKRRR